MEAIKCPNCGNGNVQELTEEKYKCLACGEEFLVHNLSKEFRQTDEHISDVHTDISRKIDNLNARMQNISNEASENASKARMVLSTAEKALKKGDFLEAYKDFKTYSAYVPDSYVGYEGMFRALTDTYRDDAGQYKRITSDMTAATVKILLSDGADVLSKALQCEDCKKEDLLNKYKEYYDRSLKTLQDRILYLKNPNDVEGILNLAENKVEAAEEAINNIRTLITQCESKIEQTNSQIVNNKEMVEFSKKQVAEFNALSEAEQKAIVNRKKIKAGAIFGVVLILAIILWGHVGLFLHIVEVVVVILVGFVCMCSTEKPAVFESNESKLGQELEKQNNELQTLQEKLLTAQENKEKIDVGIDAGIDELENFILTNNSIARSAEELFEKYSELEKPKEKTEYDVFWTECTDKKYLSIKYMNINGRGYQVLNKNHPQLPQIVLAKSTKTQSDKLLKIGDTDKTMKFLREISDDRMYTLLLMPVTDKEWSSEWFSSRLKEITGKTAEEAGLDIHIGESAQVIERSGDKEKLMDYAERLTDLGVKVRVV